MKSKTKNRVLSFLLTLAMIVGLMPGMGLTAYAAAPADTYVVAGSEWDIFGSVWDGTSEANKMTLAADGTYTKSYEVSQAYNGVQLKVVKNGSDWIGDQNGNNVTFNLTGAGTFTVAYNPNTGAVSVSGEIVAEPTATYYYAGAIAGVYSNSDYTFSATETEGVYCLTDVNLSANDWFKVMDENYFQYPEDAYNITADGTYNIYFSPDGNGGDGWYEGYIKVEAAAESDYTITIPATLDVANSGYNATGDIVVTGQLASGKKLVVNAESGDEFALVSGENKVMYKVVNDTEKEKTYADAAETKSWDFADLAFTRDTTQTIGIVVEDYSSKPAGDYSDTVTFTAKVENASAQEDEPADIPPGGPTTVVAYSFDDVNSPALTAGSRVSFDYTRTSPITSTKFLNAYNNQNGDPGASTISLGSTDLSGEMWTLTFDWAACGGCNSKPDHTILKSDSTNLFDIGGNANWNTTVTVSYNGSDGSQTLPVPGCDKTYRFTDGTGDQYNTTTYWHHFVITGGDSGVKMTITNSDTGAVVVDNITLSETNMNPTSLIIEPPCGGAIGIDELSLTYGAA